jgi:hypothetical protein
MTKSILFYSFWLVLFSSESKITVRRYYERRQLEISHQISVGHLIKNLFWLDQKNDIGSSTYFVDKNNKKPQLVSPKAAFSKLNFLVKPDSNIAYYVNKGACTAMPLKRKLLKNLFSKVVQCLIYNWLTKMEFILWAKW